MKQRRYTVLLWRDPEDGGFTVTVPALPGCVTEGDTVEEALEMTQEAIAGYIEALQQRGEPVPEEETQPQVMAVTVAA